MIGSFSRIPNLMMSAIIICAIALLFGCDKEESLAPSVGNEATVIGTINVYVTECIDLFCQEEDFLNNVKVELAIDSFSEAINTKITEEGFTSFSILSNNSYILRCSYKDQIYHERLRLSANTSSTHPIRFSKHCDLIGTDLKNCNPRIDFNTMAVGQRSQYARYVSNELASSQDKSFEYTGEILEVTVMEKLDGNAWLIRERFTEPITITEGPYAGVENTLYSRWEIEGSIVRIFQDEKFSSNFQYSFFSNDWGGDPNYSTQLVNRCELIGWSIANCINVENSYIQDVIINGFRYEDPLIYSYSSGIDAPIFGMLYNLDEGIVHTFFFGTFAPSKAHGFSLIR
ncbi:MAG: hypothetical protein ACI9P5_003081 [Saprospiraceae bacterium]|jgi:hypothetical protein